MSPLDPVQSEAPPEGALGTVVEPEEEHRAPSIPTDDGAALPVLEGRFVSVDKNGSITTWTARAEETFCFARAEVRGQPLAKLVAPGSQERVVEELGGLLQGGPALQLEIDAVDGHGREFPATLSLVPITLAAGYAFNALLQDLTKQAITPDVLARLRRDHADVLDSIRTSFDSAASGEEADERVVGALVTFDDRGGARPAPGEEEEAAPAQLPTEAPRELEDARRDAEQARREAKEARARAEEAAAEIQGAREEAEELRSQLEAASTALEEKEKELAEATDAARAASAEAEQRETKLQETDAAVEAAHAELEEARAEAGAAGKRVEELSADLASANERIEKLTSDLAAGQDQGEGLAAELTAAKERIEDLRSELATGKERIDDLTSELDAGKERIEDLRAELAAGKERIDELASEVTAGKEREETLAAEVAAGKERAESLAAELEERDSRLKELDGGSAEIQAELKREREALEAARSELEAARSKLESAREAGGEAEERAGKLEAALDSARAEAGEATRRAEELSSELEAARVEAREAGQRAEEASEALEDARREAEELRAEAASARDSSAGDVEAARGETEEARAAAEEAQAAAEEARERAEEAERFRLAFDQAPIGMALTATDGRFLRVNRSLCDLLGYSDERLLAPDPPAIVHDEDIEPKRKMAERMLAGKSSTEQVETRYLHADGRTLHVKETVSLARDAGGEPVHFVFQFEDVTERKQLEEAAAEGLDRDPVTGLFNRRRFEEELSRKIAEAAHHGGGGAAVLLNLQDFDSLKGDLPEEAGEELLRTVASALREHLGNTDVLARLSGDEFAVLLPDADADKAQSVAEQLVQAIGPQVVKVGDKSIRITLSVGVALFDERDHHSGPVPVAAVDDGSDGANLPVPVGGPSSLSPADGAPVSPEGVHRALEHDLFLLYCQPVVDLRTNDVAQYELLLRMSDEDGNLILPRAFLQTAEESGLIRSIDHWVVRRAIHLIAEGARTGKHLRLEVNLSGSSVDDPDLPGIVEQELITTGADPSALILEVSETVATARHDDVKDLAKRLRALGCRFAVDNFGSAVTSFRYIKDLPLDFLKLDGDLIATLPESRTDQLVVKAIVDIARGMGCETIAEMVADDETLFLLRQQGVGYAQGYQVGRPQPVSEI